jgi:hypothetical protein
MKKILRRVIQALQEVFWGKVNLINVKYVTNESGKRSTVIVLLEE